MRIISHSCQCQMGHSEQALSKFYASAPNNICTSLRALTSSINRRILHTFLHIFPIVLIRRIYQPFLSLSIFTLINYYDRERRNKMVITVLLLP